MAELLLGIDIGTSSSKGVLASPNGAVIATATRPHALSLPRPGWAEHDAEAIWWADFLALCSELVPRASGEIAAVCVSGFTLAAAEAIGAPAGGHAVLAAIAELVEASLLQPHSDAPLPSGAE